MRTAYARLIDALRTHGSHVDERDGTTQAQCPAHDDRNPSLSIKPRDDGKGVVFFCHAGCEYPAVLGALGWTAADLFDDAVARDVFSARRDYKYPDGRVVHRKPGKAFSQSGNIKGRSLFHADRISDSSKVYVTEGEKCAEAIEALAGVVAVSPAMGARKAHLFDWTPLRGKDVTIVADADDAGRKHAVQVAEQLDGIAKSVKIVEAAIGKDAADHVAAGKTLDEFAEVELSGVPNGTPAPTGEATEEDDKSARRSVASQLVDMGRSAYTLGVTDSDDPYGVSNDHPHLAMMLRGGKTGLRAELARQYFDAHNSVPSQQALADACNVLEGFATQEPPQRVYLRVAELGRAVFIDMGDIAGQVIEIRDGSWQVVTAAPVLFRRTKLTGQLPQPHRGGQLSELWDFVPIDKLDRPVLLAVLVSALVQTDVPHAILALLAEQGSAKSTITRLLVSLVDPSPVPLRQPPRDQDGWTTAASASWVVALDNLSGEIPSWLSDCLCRAATGDGAVKRALYTDSDVSVQSFRRCCIVNGVDLVIGRGDLAERLASIALPRVTKRRPEDELAAAWETARPRVLGGLLDLAAKVHQRLPAVKVDDLPRMADFAKVLAAVDEIHGTEGLARYREQSRRAAADTLDVPLIAELVAAGRPYNEATSAEILAAINAAASSAGPDWRIPRGWPKNARAVTGLLTRHAPALRSIGWTVDNDKGANKDGVTRWTIEPGETCPKSAPPSPPNPSLHVNGHKLGGSDENSFPAANPPGGSTAGQAGQVEIANPPKTPTMTCEDGSAGQAGLEYGQSQVPVLPGGLTPSSPGQTDRVARALATAESASQHPVRCGCGAELTLAPSIERGRCAECALSGGAA
ncbi:MAG: hypothetical protein HYZ38_05075 [Mycobacterium sp.]|nr:hypothetical protein [Mycobacterium sp.]